MGLIGSLALAIAVLSLRLMIQSKILTVDEANKVKLTKFVQKVNYMGSMPLAVIMIIAGCVWWDSVKDSFIPVGMTLLIASISMLVQTRTLEVSGDKAISFGRYLKVLAWVLAVSSIIGLIALVYLIIRPILPA